LLGHIMAPSAILIRDGASFGKITMRTTLGEYRVRVLAQNEASE